MSMSGKKQSRRQELFEFAEIGRLREVAHDGRLSEEAVDLLVDIVIRYCEPRRKPRRQGVTSEERIP
jgi:hypothetical protein